MKAKLKTTMNTGAMRIKPNVPMAVQAAELLRNRLRRDYVNGGRLPGENVIASELGVSRGTIRQALAILEREGVILRQQGTGTFANPNVLGINARVDMAYEFTQLIEAAGFEAAIDTVEVRREAASADLAQRLGLTTGDPVLTIHKIFLASGQRAIYVVEQLPTALVQSEYAESELTHPIFDFLDQRCHQRVDYIVSEIVPCVADQGLAEYLGIEPGQPILKFSEVFYSTSNAPLVLATVYFRDPLIRFHALRQLTTVT